MQGSGRKMNSMSVAEVVFMAGRSSPPSFEMALAGANAEPATRPSFNVFRQNFSKSAEGFAAFRWSRSAPSFEVVRFGDVPVAELGGLVKMRADVDGVLDGLAVFLFFEFELGSKIEIVRRGVHRINAKNEQRLDLAIVDVAAQFAQRFEIVHRMRFHGLGVVERCPNIAESRVDLVHQRVDQSGLLLSGNNETLASMFEEILSNGVEPFLTSRWRDPSVKCQSVKFGDIPDPFDESAREEFHIGSTQGQAMIGRRAGDSGRGFDHVKATHRVDNAFRNYCSVQDLGRYGRPDCGIDFLGFVHIAAAREFSRVANVSRAAAQEIGIERKDDVSFFRTIDGVDVAAEGEFRAFARTIADSGLPLVPFGFRKKGQQRLNLRGKRRRSDNPC